MSDEEFNLEEYLTSGVENIVKSALKASLSNPRESAFLAKYAVSSKRFSRLRNQAEKNGEHIPSFLIASITQSCNLHCAGCYSRAIDTCGDDVTAEQMSSDEWGKVFQESASLGIGFILLAGGEPMLRKDVIAEAAKYPEIVFPIITNGTLLTDNYLSMLNQNRNLVPVLSVEGGEETTDKRRGDGIYRRLSSVMAKMKEKGILFGASVTVTTENYREVMSRNFTEDLHEQGCRGIIFIEYVAAEKGTENLAPGDNERPYIDEQMQQLRECYEDMVFVAFPGDERVTGGCLAAGRGFFHISAFGGAEPCPFSPYSDVNVKDVGVAGALHCGLFQSLINSGLQTEDHDGACALLGKEEEIKAML